MVVAKLSAMHRIAEREGFIVAYPSGTMGKSGLTWVPGGRDSARATGDTLFVRNLVTELTQRYEVDPTRIFAAGISIGGSLVYELACRAADRLAAIAVVGGTMTIDHGVPPNPIPLIHIHGMLDRRVPFKGGRGPATTGTKEWLPVTACIEHWREINACDGEPEIVRSARDGVTGFKYRGAADIELWLVEGVGHSWPGSRRELTPDDATTPVASFSASEKIWSFFAAHPRRRAAVPRADGGTVGAHV